MSNEEILNAYDSVECIYGYMYGSPPGEIIRISKTELTLGKNGFVFIWGFPGPDYNIYRFEDYGKTWAFTESEIGEKE